MHTWLVAMPQTLLVAALAGIALGAYLWGDMKHVDTHHIASLWVVGVAFFVAASLALASFAFVRWDAWLGLLALWTTYVASAGASVSVWRRVRLRVIGRLQRGRR